MTARKTTKDEAKFKPSALCVAYAEWMTARARLAVLDANENTRTTRERRSNALDASGDAEWKMIRARSEGLQDIRRRAFFVQEMFANVEQAGEYTDGRHIAALNVLIIELLNPLLNQPDERPRCGYIRRHRGKLPALAPGAIARNSARDWDRGDDCPARHH